MAWTAVLTRPFSWWRNPPKTDYEEVLADLTAEIEETQANLVQIKARTRRASLILPFWATLAWLTWTAGCYFLGLLDRAHLHSNIWLVWWPIIVAPLIIFFARRIVRWWYRRVQAAEDKHLKELQKQRRTKIEEIKKATRYDHLRSLLEKYDEDTKTGKSPQRQQIGGTPTRAGQTGKPVAAPGGPSFPPGVRPPPQSGMQQQQAGAGQPLPSGMRGSQQQQQQFGRPVATLAPGQRTWLDRMADAVLGADPSSAVLGPEQKYALICSQCKRHNGLATKEEFVEIQYICPHCGSFESRRPSSVPVSSPWHHGQRPSSAAGHNESRPSTPLKKAAEPQPSRSRGIATNGGRAADTSADSPPPASPLGGAHESDDDDTGPIEGRAGDHRTQRGDEAGGAQLRRSARKASGMEVD